jgi:hypothetical protein
MAKAAEAVSSEKLASKSVVERLFTRR